MRPAFLCLACLVAGPVLACDRPVCEVDPGMLALARVITFDDQRAGMGPGMEHREVLALPGARFGEHFMGQRRWAEGDFDRVDGPGLAPLMLLPGPPGELFSIHRLGRSNVINGFGPAGFPRDNAQGEGALAVLFDEDQAALGFDVLGGEDGAAFLVFLARDGRVIDRLRLDGLREREFAFRRSTGQADIAGFVLTNDDPQGIAIDNLRFGQVPQLG